VGRYGPYIKYDGRNIKIPKDIDVQDITLEEVLKIIRGA
jgi:topoisomerase IA-like protein